jgi:hypothetical protein
VRLPAAKTFELTEDAVASSAVIAMIVNPASPSTGRAASASAVSPCSITSSIGSVPKTPRLTATYTRAVMPSARYIARGSDRAGFERSPAVKVTTEKPRYAKNVSATDATILLHEG